MPDFLHVEANLMYPKFICIFLTTIKLQFSFFSESMQSRRRSRREIGLDLKANDSWPQHCFHVFNRFCAIWYFKFLILIYMSTFLHNNRIKVLLDIWYIEAVNLILLTNCLYFCNSNSYRLQIPIIRRKI